MSEVFTEVVCVAPIDYEGNIIGQLRDDKPGINSPGKVGCFGGYVEPGDATLMAAMLRELNEETNLALTEADLEPFGTYISGTGTRMRHNMFIAKGINPEGLEVYEGQRAYTVKRADDPLLTGVMRAAATKWFAERDKIMQAGPENPEVHRCASTLFVTPGGELYGHQRDDKPGIDQPGKIGGFGGTVEAGETSLEAAVRELGEETNLGLTAGQLELFGRWVMWRPMTREYEQSTVYLARNVNLAQIEVYEGQGIAKISGDTPKIALTFRPVVRKWFAQ